MVLFFLFPPRFEAWTSLKCIVALVFSVFSSSLGNWKLKTPICLFLVSFVNLDVETLFLYLFSIIKQAFKSRKKKKKNSLKIENWEKNSYQIVGGQEHTGHSYDN